MSSENNHLYRFGEFSLDPIKQVLHRGGNRVQLGSKDIHVLHILVAAAGTTVSKDELTKKVWGEVGDNSLNQAISAIRKALSDDPKHPTYIKTVDREGFRFIEDVKHESRFDKTKTRSGRRIIWTLALAMTVVIGLFGWWLRAERLGNRADMSPWLSEARQYKRVGDDEQALNALDEALAGNEGDVEAHLEEAEIYYDLGQNDKAHEQVRKAEQNVGRLSEDGRLKLEALKLEFADDLEGAVAKYQLLIDRRPNDVEARYFFASAAMLEPSRRAEADQSLRVCLGIDPLNPHCNEAQLDLWVYENRFGEVLAAYDRLHTKLRGYPWLEEPAAVASWATDNLVGATTHLTALKDARIAGALVHGAAHRRVAEEWTAEMLLYQGKLGAARQTFRTLAENAPTAADQASELLELGRAEALMGSPVTAAGVVKEALQLSNSPTTLQGATEVLAMAGATRAAQDALAKWKISDPQSSHNGPFNNFVQGSLLLTDSQAMGAIAHLEQSTKEEQGATDFEAVYLLVQAYMRAGQWDKAVNQLRYLTEQKGTVLLDEVGSIWPLAQYSLAICYQRLGKEDDASATFNRFLKVWSEADSQLLQPKSTN